TGLSSPAAARWVAAVRAEDRIRDDDVAWLMPAARRFLDDTSPASIDDSGLARIAMPVFLIHGEEDPLVPVDEMRRLAQRLSAHATVRAFPSRLLAHVEVGSPGLVEGWRHLRFLQDFFDTVASRGGVG